MVVCGHEGRRRQADFRQALFGDALSVAPCPSHLAPLVAGSHRLPVLEASGTQGLGEWAKHSKGASESDIKAVLHATAPKYLALMKVAEELQARGCARAHSPGPPEPVSDVARRKECPSRARPQGPEPTNPYLKPAPPSKRSPRKPSLAQSCPTSRQPRSTLPHTTPRHVFRPRHTPAQPPTPPHPTLSHLAALRSPRPTDPTEPPALCRS